MQDASRQLGPAVTATLGALGLTDVDQAAARLADSYARALDQASAIEAAADRVLRAVERDSDADPDLVDQMRALRNRLTARQALADLGPKLTAALVELGATPKARAAIAKGQPPAETPTGGALARLRSVSPGA